MENQQANQPQTTLGQPMGWGFLALAVGGLLAVAAAKVIGRALETDAPSTRVPSRVCSSSPTRSGSWPQPTLLQKRAEADRARNEDSERRRIERDNAEREIRKREDERKTRERAR